MRRNYGWCFTIMGDCLLYHLQQHPPRHTLNPTSTLQVHVPNRSTTIATKRHITGHSKKDKKKCVQNTYVPNKSTSPGLGKVHPTNLEVLVYGGDYKPSVDSATLFGWLKKTPPPLVYANTTLHVRNEVQKHGGEEK